MWLKAPPHSGAVPVWFILLLFAAALSLVAWRHREPGVDPHSAWCPVITAVDFIPNHTAGLALRHGLPVYGNLRSQGGDFVDPIPDHEGIVSRFGYAPPVAYLFRPLSRFSRAAAWKIWLAAVITGLTLVLALFTRLAGGGALFCAGLAVTLLAYYPLWFVLLNGNIAAACLPLLVLAIYLAVTGRSERAAALFLALAVTLKPYPGLLWLHCAARRRWGLAWRTAAWLLLLLAFTWRGNLWPTFIDRLRRYDAFVQAWAVNASLFSLLVMAGTPVQLAAAARLLGAAAVAFALGWVRNSSQDRAAVLYEYGLLCLLMLLPPNTMYDYNLIFAIPALAAVWFDLRRGAPGGRRALAVAAFAYAALAVPTQAALGVTGSAALAGKFPWLLLFTAAVAWRHRQLQRRGATLPPANGAAGR